MGLCRCEIVNKIPDMFCQWTQCFFLCLLLFLCFVNDLFVSHVFKMGFAQAFDCCCGQSDAFSSIPFSMSNDLAIDWLVPSSVDFSFSLSLGLLHIAVRFLFVPIPVERFRLRCLFYLLLYRTIFCLFFWSNLNQPHIGYCLHRSVKQTRGQ